MNYTDTIELRVGFEVTEPNKLLFWTGPITDGHTLKYDIEGSSTIHSYEREGGKGAFCIFDLMTTDKRFSSRVSFFVEAGKTEEDSEVKELLNEYVLIARKSLIKKIRLHLLEKICAAGIEKDIANEFRANNIV